MEVGGHPHASCAISRQMRYLVDPLGILDKLHGIKLLVVVAGNLGYIGPDREP